MNYYIIPTIAVDCRNPIQANSATDAAEADYAWKANLKDEGTQRLSMWEAANWGKTYTTGIVAAYKNLVDDAVKREINFRNSGQIYRNILASGTNCYPAEYNQAEIDRVDKNYQISSSDQDKELGNYKIVENDFQRQQFAEQLKEKAQKDMDKARSDYEWKGNSRNEAMQRLSIWQQIHWGDIIITNDSFQQYKTLTNDAIQKGKDFRSSGQAYIIVLFQYNNFYDTTSEIDRINQNNQQSTTDQQNIIQNFQQIETRYLNQEQLETVGTYAGLALVGLLILTLGIKKLKTIW